MTSHPTHPQPTTAPHPTDDPGHDDARVEHGHDEHDHDEPGRDELSPGQDLVEGGPGAVEPNEPA